MRPVTACHGTGCADGTTPEVCPDCHGTGQVQVRRQTPMGVFATTVPLRPLRRQGQDHPTALHALPRQRAGARSARPFRPRSPPASTTARPFPSGDRATPASNGGPAGDLLITITVRPHELFRRDGTSVLCEAPITFAQAALGAELEIPTIDGKVKYNLPEGTQSGTTFRLKGKGIPELQRPGPGRPVRYRLHRDAPRI